MVVSSFQRSAYLRLCLRSIAGQRGVDGEIELVVADDGSNDDTEDVVRQVARDTGFPIKFTSHAHDGFRLARCRNEGVLATSGDYVLFTDGDCLLPPDHVATHLRHRRRGFVMAGNCYRLDADCSERLTRETRSTADLVSLVRPHEAKRVFWNGVRAKCYELLRVPMRPRLSGSNIGVWRADCERVNGFDENFVGWGFEDKDFQRRLASVGVRTTLIRSKVYHLWHQKHATYAHKGRGTPNYDYFHNANVVARCRNGLNERRNAGFTCKVFGSTSHSAGNGSSRAAATRETGVLGGSRGDQQT